MICSFSGQVLRYKTSIRLALAKSPPLPPSLGLRCKIRSNSPRRRSHLSVILQRLIRGQPDPGKDEIRDEPHYPKGGSHPSQSAHQRPLTPVHGVLQPESLGVGFIGESEELFERVSGDVGVGSAGECLFDLLAKGHPGLTKPRAGARKVSAFGHLHGIAPRGHSFAGLTPRLRLAQQRIRTKRPSRQTLSRASWDWAWCCRSKGSWPC